MNFDLNPGHIFLHFHNTIYWTDHRSVLLEEISEFMTSQYPFSTFNLQRRNDRSMYVCKFTTFPSSLTSTHVIAPRPIRVSRYDFVSLSDNSTFASSAWILLSPGSVNSIPLPFLVHPKTSAASARAFLRLLSKAPNQILHTIDDFVG